MDVVNEVLERYSASAQAVEPALCCPVEYDRRLLEALPQEILERDYGCGDPSRYVREGDTVLDLGSGSGKICYIAAQLAGPRGRVIGVDMNPAMLALARRHQGAVAARIGGDRVEFRRGRIEDLALDLDALDAELARAPVRDADGWARLAHWQATQRRERPLIADGSIDLVVSNCVLNLVADGDKRQLLREVFRVLRPGGRVAISDIVADEPVPDALKADPELWTGCISGAFQEQAFMAAFREAGFLSIAIDQWSAQPWQTIAGIEFRAVTLTAVKGETAARVDAGHAVIYRGPFAEVTDDDGRVYPRGERMAVSDRTYRLLTAGPCAGQFVGIAPAVPRESGTCCIGHGTRRAPAETKGARHGIAPAAAASGTPAPTGTSCC